MKRREFIAGLSAAAWPLPARTQQSMPVVGFLMSGSRSSNAFQFAAFRKGLSEGGYVEGRNIAIESRFADNQLERLPALAAELVRHLVAVIAAGSRADEAAKLATAIIPIVFINGGDPVRNGLVASLNRPGGNLTGVTLLSSDIVPKRLGLLRELVPQANTIAILLDATFRKNREFQLQEMQEAGRSIGVRIVGVWVGGVGEFDTAFATAQRDGAGALVVAAAALFVTMRDHLTALAALHRIPTVYQAREYAESGGLMSYGPSYTDAYRQGGVYTGRILKGERPADLPVQLPTKFELVINLKTAKTLGLEIPPGILAIADEVIE